MKANGPMTRKMDKELKYIKMEPHIQDNFLMDKNLERVN